MGIATSLAQNDPTSNLRLRKVALHPAGLLVDSLTVAPGSLDVFLRRDSLTRQLSVPLPRTDYALSVRYLQWLRRPPADSAWLLYRVLPFDLSARRFVLDTTDFQRDAAGQLIGTYDPYVRTDVFDSDGRVNYNGSFSRGISFGNRQDLVLNSAFNLQLEGELGNGILVRAAITDESLPVQPEGNTQQLREFDQVFIQLEKGNSQLTAGDYELRHPEGFFMRYFKKLEGATFRTNHGETEDGGRWDHAASVAIARGQFIRQPIQPGEGNQGPYKLTGEGNLRFLIVLSGTERIYLDGQLLRRGEDADYVIDYNLAELTFTQRRLITRDSRIVAEYEYADQRYVRSLYAANTRYRKGPWTGYLNLYNQQDSKTATGELELSLDQRRQLAEAGDQDAGLFVSSVDSLDGRASQRATYRRVDTLVLCGAEVLETFVLRLTTAAEGPLFTAAFTDLGPSGGPYELEPLSSANERAFRYVGYDESCRPLGRFAPVVELVAPQRQQLITVGGGYRSANTRINVEGARSLLDRNRFSDLDTQDNAGYALRIDAEHATILGRRDSSWQLATDVHYERRQAEFRPVNPYRSTDFFRNWNLSNRLGTSVPDFRDEELLEGRLRFSRPGWGGLEYGAGRFTRADTYAGIRQNGRLNVERNGWQLNGKASYLASSKEDDNGTDGVEGTFWRPELRLAKRIGESQNWEVSTEYAAERSLQRNTATDTLLPVSFGFERLGVGLSATPTDTRYQFNLRARRRRDELPNGGAELVTATLADEILLDGAYSPGADFRLGGNFNFRSLEVVNREVVNQTPGQTFLGRLDLSFRSLRRSLRSQTVYTLGSGQEARVEFQYLFVGAGLGQYIWQDSLFNNDGRIQPNEMALSPFPDIADYVRVSVFTNDFIRTDNAGINQSLSWDPERIWKKPVGWQKFAERFNFQSSLTINRKTREDGAVQAWNPFQLAIADSSLVALSAATRHNVFFNRRDPKYDIQLSQRDLRRRQVITTGYEANAQREWTLRLRYRPVRSLNLVLAGSMGERNADSENFDEKDFQLRFRRLEPEADWQPGEDFRFNLQLIVGEEVNELETSNGERSNRREIRVTGNFRRWLDLSVRNVAIDFTGEARSPVGFALLNGLQPGRNWLWNLNLTRQLGPFLQLNIGYEGRQTGTAPTVHVGRAQVTALF